jgi:hypothetical protein
MPSRSSEDSPRKPAQIARPADTAKSALAKAPARRPTANARAAASRSAPGPYWVQVGAFQDQSAARRLADKLRSENYRVAESAIRAGSRAAPAPAVPTIDRYNVFVSGLPPADLKAKLDAKGLGSDPVAGGVVLTPSLPLREAVALSRDLAGDGLQVQVRRASGMTASAARPTASGVDGPTFHRVRVGSFPDSASARAVLRELEAKGYKPFLGRGTP